MSLDISFTMSYDDGESYQVFDANITNNLHGMANEAGIGDILWYPHRVGVERAGQMVDKLSAGIELMKSDPLRFEAFNASNGWGTRKQFVPWLEELLVAAQRYPNASISVFA